MKNPEDNFYETSVKIGKQWKNGGNLGERRDNFVD